MTTLWPESELSRTKRTTATHPIRALDLVPAAITVGKTEVTALAMKLDAVQITVTKVSKVLALFYHSKSDHDSGWFKKHTAKKMSF